MLTALAVLGRHAGRQKDVLSPFRPELGVLLITPGCFWGAGCNHRTWAEYYTFIIRLSLAATCVHQPLPFVCSLQNGLEVHFNALSATLRAPDAVMYVAMLAGAGHSPGNH